MSDEKFYEKVDKMFESKLYYEEVPVIRVKDIKNNKILEDLNYNFIRFDSLLNMYKITNEGNWVLVQNENFKPVVVQVEKTKK